MANRISDRMVKAFERFNADLKEFGEETGETFVTLYEDALPEGYLQTRVDMFSYQTLRRIVAQRHNHRLPEWHQFIDWIKTLPLAEELILDGLEIK